MKDNRDKSKKTILANQQQPCATCRNTNINLFWHVSFSEDKVERRS